MTRGEKGRVVSRAKHVQDSSKRKEAERQRGREAERQRGRQAERQR